MGATKIQWTDETWNPIRGCTTVSEGCRNCYAMRMASRFNGPGMAYEGLARGGHWTGKPRVIESEIERPLRWRRKRRCFVCSMSDLFHKDVPDDVITRLFGVMGTASAHTFQVLTKRPERMSRLVRRWRRESMEPGPNVWLGTSVEDQATADERCQALVGVRGLRWLSVEPLLGPVNLKPYLAWIRWVVVGGESGPGARPMHPEWARSIRDQCQEAGVAFFFKQWGAWSAPVRRNTARIEDGPGACWIGDHLLLRVGKKAAGRELDGRTWDEYPA